MAVSMGPSPSGPVRQVGLVHDWLNQRGGAENVLEILHGVFPAAPIYTSLYQPAHMPGRMRHWDIRTSWLNRLPLAHIWPRCLLPLYPHAFARLDLSHLDLVISIKSAFCLGVTTGSDTAQARHICYCLTPTRFLWDFDTYMQREAIPAFSRLVARPLIRNLRRWEVEAAARVDHFIAISRTVQVRIRNCYGRASTIIHPPVNTHEFQGPAETDTGESYYLIVSRLIPYKRIDLAVAAFNRMPDRKLIIVGAGRDAQALQAQAGANIVFTGFLERPQVISLLRGCRAFIFPGEEDFGIAPVEAMSAGKPVIAYQAGGALDYVRDQATGLFFPEQTPEALAEAVQACDSRAWDAAACRQQAEQFSTDRFRQKFTAYIQAHLET